MARFLHLLAGEAGGEVLVEKAGTEVPVEGVAERGLVHQVQCHRHIFSIQYTHRTMQIDVTNLFLLIRNIWEILWLLR